MPRPRKPTATLELSGAFSKNPNRKRERSGEPRPNPNIGRPPAYFDEELRAIWAEYVDEAAPGVLTKSDRKVLELACRLTWKMRVVPGKMNRWLAALARVLEASGVANDIIADFAADIRCGFGMSAQEAALLRSCWASMGLTPADRSKVNVGTDVQVENEFSAFLN